jgi:hypothetical protein
LAAGGAAGFRQNLEPFVADIFHEVDEEVRRERLARIWQRYSALIIAGCVLVVLGVGGWRGYAWYVAREAAIAGGQFEAAAALADQGKAADAEAAFAKVAAEAPGGYATLARFRAAAELAKAKKTDEAVKAYDTLAADASLTPLWQDLAAVRAAILLVDTAPLSEMQRRLEPLAESGRTYRHSARDLLALSAWRAKDFAAAKKYLDMIAGDAETPSGVRSRADMLAALIAGNGKS